MYVTVMPVSAYTALALECRWLYVRCRREKVRLKAGLKSDKTVRWADVQRERIPIIRRSFWFYPNKLMIIGFKRGGGRGWVNAVARYTGLGIQAYLGHRWWRWFGCCRPDWEHGTSIRRRQSAVSSQSPAYRPPRPETDRCLGSETWTPATQHAMYSL